MMPCKRIPSDIASLYWLEELPYHLILMIRRTSENLTQHGNNTDYIQIPTHYMKAFRHDLEGGCCFSKITSCKAVQIIIGYCNISTVFHHQMVLGVYGCEKLLHSYQVLWSKHMDKMGDYRLLSQSR